MLTYTIMGVIIIGFIMIMIWGMRFTTDKNDFMSVNDTIFLRAFWCIIIVMVHVPTAYQNRIQDMMGSFAYVGVTFFFITSSFGLKWNLDHKKDYMNCFWRRRLPRVLVPAILANAFGVFVSGINGEEISLFSFININNWVKVLILYYLAFYVIYYFIPKYYNVGRWQDVILCAFVICCSLLDRLTMIKVTSIWIVEPLGFAYGIILANHVEQIKRWFESKWVAKLICFLLLSIFVGIAYLKYKMVAFVGDYLLKIVLGIFISVFVYIVLSKFKVGNKATTFLGIISYEVYLLHDNVFDITSLIPGIGSGVFILMSLIISIILAYIFHYICDIILYRTNVSGRKIL